jgi:large subunit ribosomal protein L3
MTNAINYIIGRKIGMTQVFGDKGIVIPVTVVQAGPCIVTQLKSMDKDGYTAVQIAFEEQKKQRTNKAEAGHFKVAGTTPKKTIREFRVEGTGELKLGDVIAVNAFTAGDFVDVTANTKGHGFTGAIKRHNFSMQNNTHGNSRTTRMQGSIGACSTPARVFKNKKMPGHYGNEQVTVQNLTIVKVDKEKNCIFIKGGLPGPTGALITVKNAVKRGAK